MWEAQTIQGLVMISVLLHTLLLPLSGAHLSAWFPLSFLLVLLPVSGWLGEEWRYGHQL